MRVGCRFGAQSGPRACLGSMTWLLGAGSVQGRFSGPAPRCRLGAGQAQWLGSSVQARRRVRSVKAPVKAPVKAR